MSRVLKTIPYEEYLLRGNAACPGCGAELTLRYVLKALGPKTIMVIPACCTSVIAGPYPRTAFNVPVLHIAFAASAAAASGIAEAVEQLGKKDVNVVVWAGDGGTVDIGLQALSGAAERNHNLFYICYDNEAYMNTGIQKSGSTPYGAWTTTTPTGNKGFKKDLPTIMKAHGVPYIATLNPAFPNDILAKINKAKKIRGFKYFHALSPCPPGWRFDSSTTIEVARMAVLTGMWILYEWDRGIFRLTGPSRGLLNKEKRKHVIEYLKLQGRFRHISKEDIEILQEYVDNKWEEIKSLIGNK
ncbi:MAG: 2-ketoisovalerate ferredoxin oxidoreductase [Thermofilum sp. ex4484_79]|nr:MAG: 2-ketoisovalerate ferredoxin oxidoreductase [Thermofilum sp. ex4484_79]